ncbi:MAG: histidinol dehydrogenase [Acidobacteria bacterium]|jgi:histidinol dehydrogenase|nr:MAG: histidinol dehydrogenase [Acidobacteriota bacterium]
MPIRILRSGDEAAIDRLLMADGDRSGPVELRVAEIVARVRRSGDSALLGYARRLDKLRRPIELTPREIREGAQRAPAQVRRAIRDAARHVRAVARKQVPKGFRVTTAPGVVVEQRVTPLDRVGCYVPGGRHPLPSSLLMTAIPARAAGVGEVIVACPRPEPAVLAAAVEAGVSRLFQMGGAHAIAALAYGTRTVPRVDKIVGPGNRFVAAAKALVSRDCGIDFYAGPTEILIVTDDGPAAWIAADLIAQAEHDIEARAIFITSNADLARQVETEIRRQMPVDGPARRSLAAHGGIVLTGNEAESIALANRAAPEHLVCSSERVARAVRCAGAIFIGSYTAQVAGDYAIGSNHVLPTSGAARYRGGLSAADFVRLTSVQRVTPHGLAALAPTVIALARAEGLSAHAASIEVRLK